MQFAESIRYGGQLIDAEDCDYESYHRLGLLCPECKCPVFLRAKHERLIKGQIVKVKPSFAHFKAIDPKQIAQCENRVSVYSKVDIEKRVVSARNQRLKLLQRWFWEIFINSNNGLKSVADHLTTKEGMYYLEQDPLGVIHEAIEYLALLDTDSITEAISGCLEKTCSEYEFKKHSIGKNTRQRVEYLIGFDKEFHILICTEVLLFLKAKSSFYLLNKTIACAYLVLHLSDTAKKVGLDKEPVSLTLVNLLQVITLIPWFDEFQRLENK